MNDSTRAGVFRPVADDEDVAVMADQFAADDHRVKMLDSELP